MSIERRFVLTGAALAAFASPLAAIGRAPRFGMIGRIKAQPGKRPELAAALVEGSGSLPGCLSYVVAEDEADSDTVWVTEVWTDEASHRASLRLPQVRAAIVKGRPLVASFDTVARTRPIAGL